MFYFTIVLKSTERENLSYRYYCKVKVIGNFFNPGEDIFDDIEVEDDDEQQEIIEIYEP